MIMFIGLGKMLGKTRIRLGVGMRITKSNAIWMLFALMLIWTVQLTWYMMVLCFWFIYALGYGIYWIIKQIIRKTKGNR